MQYVKYLIYIQCTCCIPVRFQSLRNCKSIVESPDEHYLWLTVSCRRISTDIAAEVKQDIRKVLWEKTIMVSDANLNCSSRVKWKSSAAVITISSCSSCLWKNKKLIVTKLYSSWYILSWRNMLMCTTCKLYVYHM